MRVLASLTFRRSANQCCPEYTGSCHSSEFFRFKRVSVERLNGSLAFEFWSPYGYERGQRVSGWRDVWAHHSILPIQEASRDDPQTKWI